MPCLILVKCSPPFVTQLSVRSKKITYTMYQKSKVSGILHINRGNFIVFNIMKKDGFDLREKETLTSIKHHPKKILATATRMPSNLDTLKPCFFKTK